MLTEGLGLELQRKGPILSPKDLEQSKWLHGRVTGAVEGPKEEPLPRSQQGAW